MHTMEMNGRQVMFPKYYTNLDELEARLKMFSYRCRKKDCLDLPDKLYSQRYIDLTEEQKKVYVDLKKKALAVVKDETISYANKLTEVLRLHQVVNGFVKTDEGNIKAFKTNPKLKELMSILEESLPYVSPIAFLISFILYTLVIVTILKSGNKAKTVLIELVKVLRSHI